MAHCKQTPQEFIKNAFTPQIAVLCSPLAEKACEKNNLNFVELLQPFSKLSSDIHYKDPTGNVITIRNLKLTFLDVNTRPPQTTLARKFLNSSVSEASENRTQTVLLNSLKLIIPTSTPWFEAWRETFLKVQYPSDHEYTMHFLSCILVVSSLDNNPLETMVQLAQTLNHMQNTAPGKLPKWFNANILKYYVVVHDTTEGPNSALDSYEAIKSSYGASNCFLLRMNSRPPGQNTHSEHLPDPWSQFIANQLDSRDLKVTPQSSPNTARNNILDVAEEANESKVDLNYHPLSPDTDDLTFGDTVNEKEKSRKTSTIKSHGHCLSTEDVEQIKAFVHEFARNSLIPYIERQIQTLSDTISNKKGMSRSLFSATKRWFNPNKPGAGAVAVNNLIYAADAPELQVRKLGDLYFMFGHYSLAYHSYHLAKRDYNTDQAWLYYAGALEMAALSAFMTGETNRKTLDYMEESITTYLNTCKMPQFATRATLLSSECLKNRGMFGEAAHQLIRMTSEESDLRSALLLEQAAYCFLQSKMTRKYAFHMVLAGHRFSKAAQRKHSLRSYKQAYQVYEGSGWDLAGDHIHNTIGRQANNLQCYDEAVDSFSKLLLGESKQTSQQQGIFLKEYLTILENKLKNSPETSIPVLPLPKLSRNLNVLVGPTPPLKTPGRVPAMGVTFNNEADPVTEQKWVKMEEMLVQEAQGSLPMLFKPMITLYDRRKLGTTLPNAIVNEPIQVLVEFVNLLQIVLNLKEIYLLWTFKDENTVKSNELSTSNNIEKFMKTHITKTIIIEGGSRIEAVLSLTPLVVGQVTISGVCYTLGASNSPNESTFIKGKQLIYIAGSKDVNNDIRKPLEIRIVPPAPCLQVSFSELNLHFLCDELQKVTIDFQNSGSVPLHKVYMATSVPHLISYCEFFKDDGSFTNEFPEIETPSVKEKYARKNHIIAVPLPENALEPGMSTSLNIWIKAPSVKGPITVDLLIYYENVDSKSMPRYRLVRHSWNLTVQESISVEVTALESFNPKENEELTVAIKSTNLNKIHNSVVSEVNLLNVGLLSRSWIFTKDIVTPKFINLHSQESAHILLKTRRTVSEISQYSSISLYPEKKMYVDLSRACMAFAKKTERRTVNTFDDSIFEKFVDNKNGLLVLQWQALVIDANNKKIINGQSQIPIQVNLTNLCPLGDDDLVDLNSDCGIAETDLLETSIYSKKGLKEEKLEAQLVFNLLFTPVINHDFNLCQICIVPITLIVHSLVEDEERLLIVNTLDNPADILGLDTTKSVLCFPMASKNFCWVGSAKVSRTIQPLSTETISLSIIVYGPGTFDLRSHIEILCAKIDEPESSAMQVCHIPSTLIVSNGNS